MSENDLKRQLFDTAIENEALRRLGKGLTKAQTEDIIERAWEKLGAIGDPDNKLIWGYEMDNLFFSLRESAPHLVTTETPATSPRPGQAITARQRLELANQKIAADRAAATRDDAA